MRALIILMVSVVLLATVQASYVAASAKWGLEDPKPNYTSDDHHKQEVHDRHHHLHNAKHHDQKHKHASVSSIENTDKKNTNHISSDTETRGNIKPAVPPFFEDSRKHNHNRYEPEDEGNHSAKKSKVRVERVEVEPHPEMRIMHKKKPSKSNSIYSHMQGDDPTVIENDDKTQNPKGKKKNSNKKSKKGKKGNMKNKNKKPSRIACATDEDCNGGCCVPSRKGGKICKTANIRELGDKCASSCVCTSDLRCFVSEYKRNGDKRNRKPNKRVVGRCISSSLADINKGYFIEEQQMTH